MNERDNNRLPFRLRIAVFVSPAFFKHLASNAITYDLVSIPDTPSPERQQSGGGVAITDREGEPLITDGDSRQDIGVAQRRLSTYQIAMCSKQLCQVVNVSQ
jgi:hypothetical protein